MFFILSKLLNVLFSPFVWVVLAVLVSLFCRNRWRRYLQILAFVVLLIFSNAFIFNTIAGLWETETIRPGELDEDHRTAVVLGGMASENMHNGLPTFGKSADRLWQGLWLLKTGSVDTLVISGGLGQLFDDQKSEGVLMEEYLTDVNLMDDRIMIEPDSRNTYENARFTAGLFEHEDRLPGIVLVTSAFHTPRARACFQKQGFDVEVFPADPLSSVRPVQWKDVVIPSAAVMDQWGILFREWAGIMMYKFNGYI